MHGDCAVAIDAEGWVVKPSRHLPADAVCGDRKEAEPEGDGVAVEDALSVVDAVRERAAVAVQQYPNDGAHADTTGDPIVVCLVVQIPRSLAVNVHGPTVEVLP